MSGANSYPVRPGEIRSCPARLFFSTRKRLFCCASSDPPVHPGRYLPNLSVVRLLYHEAVPMDPDEGPMSDFVRGLKCRLCGKAYPKQALNFCEEDFGPLEVDYDYDSIAEAFSREKVSLRPFNMW